MHPHILKTTYIFAEDSKIFINQAERFGIGSFLHPFAGYLTTMSRLFAYIAILVGKTFNNFLLVGEMLEILSMVFIGIIGGYFSSNEFKHIIKSPWLRLTVFAIVVIMMADFSVTMYGGVGIHWWCCILVILSSLQLINNKLPNWAIIPIIVISILSSASCIILFFSILYYIWINMDKKISPKTFFKNIQKSDLIKLLILSAATILQAVVILLNKQNGDSSVGLGYYRMLFDHLIEVTLASPFFVLGNKVFHSLTSSGFGIPLGGAIWVAMFYLAYRKKLTKYCVFSFVYIISLYLMILYKEPSIENLNVNYDNLINNWYWIFYNAIPSFIVIFLFIQILHKYTIPNKKFVPLFFATLFLLACTYYQNLHKLDLSVNEDLIIVNEHLDFSSNQYVKVKNTPYQQDWYLMIPVKSSYCEERQCQNIWEVE